MKLKLEVELAHTDGPQAANDEVADALSEDLVGSTYYVQIPDEDEETAYEIASLKVLD